ncbi:MAG TPA: sensor domain-containing diguanylate cyclase [Burkholderiales bacterium]|jgi:diguanylate cyclase (GGDEF)-like protein/PAS domain S-box-containing protein|nr:sensor domain-containing diguanylate cyclase [Burkholderiales bacterium]
MDASLSAVADLFDVLPDAVIVVDGAGRIVLANSGVRRVLGYAAEELVGQPLGRLIPENYRAQHDRHLAQFRSQGQPRAMGSRPVLHALGKSGTEVPVSIAISNLDIQGERFSVAVIRDASIVRDRLREAIVQAESDVLTGIGNRLHLTHRMQTLVAGGRPFGLLFLDLRQFKRLNDEHGHKIGDEVLRLVAKRIQALVRAQDVAVRFGGDEFVILFDFISDPRLLAARAAAIVESIEQPFQIDSVSGMIGVNIGGAIHPRDGISEEDLIAAADRNMYRAKRSQQPYCIDQSPTDR